MIGTIDNIDQIDFDKPTDTKRLVRNRVLHAIAFSKIVLNWKTASFGQPILPVLNMESCWISTLRLLNANESQ